MSALAIWQLVRRFWPYAVGALVVIAAVLAVRHYGKVQYNAGVDALAAKWRASEAEAAAKAFRLAQERQQAVNAAQVAAAERDRVYALKTAPIKVEVQSYAKSPAAVVRCVDPVGVSIGAKAIAAANAATRATD